MRVGSPLQERAPGGDVRELGHVGGSPLVVGRDDNHLGDALHHRDHLEQVLTGPLGVGIAEELHQRGPLKAPCQSFALPYEITDERVPDVSRQVTKTMMQQVPGDGPGARWGRAGSC